MLFILKCFQFFGRRPALPHVQSHPQDREAPLRSDVPRRPPHDDMEARVTRLEREFSMRSCCCTSCRPVQRLRR